MAHSLREPANFGASATLNTTPASNIASLFAEGLALHQAGRLSAAEKIYCQILQSQPDHFDSLHLRGVIFHQRGNHAEAVSQIDFALRSNPDHIYALNNRGVILHDLKRFDEALASYDRAIAVRPDYAEALSNRGNTLQALQRFEEALASYDRAITAQLDYAEALSNRGTTLHALQRLEEALASYDRALTVRPDYAEALSNRGNTLQALQRFEEALASCDHALTFRQDHVEALVYRGNALHMLKRLEEALASYDRAVAIRPEHAEALSNRGLTLHELNRFEEALASYDRALTVRPDYAEALYNRGNTLHALQRFEEALASYDRAITAQPDYAEALSNRGITLHALQRLEDALTSYDRALVLRPDYAEALSNRGITLVGLQRLQEALTSYDRAVDLKPDYAEAHFNRSLALLLQGNYADGWEEYEWRWKGGAKGARLRRFDCPQWRGEDLVGKAIFLYDEQGYGDAIQFLRYVPLVALRGGRVILEVSQALLRLVERLDGAAQVFASGGTVPSVDFYCPLLSLPVAFSTTIANIPSGVPYLAADSAEVAAWSRRLVDLEGVRVGLVWAGSSRPGLPEADRIDRRRSITLRHFAKLADVRGVSFVSLQKGQPRSQTLSPPPGLLVHDWTDELHDFGDTAALIECLDLVISVDTSVVHLAAALGKPVWLLNRFDTCWRWLLGRDDSPWYPTLRQFRQPKPGDWDSVVMDVRAALTAARTASMRHARRPNASGSMQ